MDWQPIETAPKNGKIILLLSAPYEEYGVCSWCERAKEWRYVTEDGYAKTAEGDTYTEYTVLSVPTHWMPLPNLPEVTE